MSIADDVKAALLPAPTPCLFVSQIALLDEGDANAIGDGIEAGMTGHKVAAIMTRNGHPINEKTVRRHLEQICSCA